jgi:hypothetical protein
MKIQNLYGKDAGTISGMTGGAGILRIDNDLKVR